MAPVIERYKTGKDLASFQSGPQNDPSLALGKWMSTSPYTSDVLENVFRAYTLAEMQGPSNFYFAFGFINSSVDDLVDCRIVVPSFSLPAGVSIALGVDNVLGMDVRANAMKEISANTVEPTGISWSDISTLTTYASGLKMGVSPNDQDLTNLVQAQVWHRITLNAASNFTPGFDDVTLRIQGS